MLTQLYVVTWCHHSLTRPWWVNTVKPEENCWQFAGNIFKFIFESIFLKENICLLYPTHNEVVGGGVYWFHSIRPFVHPPPRFRSVAPTVLVRSISYLYILSSNFRRCVVCKVYGKKIQNLYFWQFFKICNFDFVLFWLGMWCESLVWVIMGRQGVSQNADVLAVLVFIQISLKYITVGPNGN